MRTRLTLFVLLAATLPGLGGCVFDPDIEEVVGVIRDEIKPARLRLEATVHIGRALLTVANVALGLTGDSDARQARAMLKGVHSIHLGVYEVNGRARRGLRMPNALRERMTERGWKILVRVEESDTVLWLLSRPKKERVGGLYVIILEEEELVVVKLEGDLSRTVRAAVRQALRNDPHMFDPLREAAGA